MPEYTPEEIARDLALCAAARPEEWHHYRIELSGGPARHPAYDWLNGAATGWPRALAEIKRLSVEAADWESTAYLAEVHLVSAEERIKALEEERDGWYNNATLYADERNEYRARAEALEEALRQLVRWWRTAGEKVNPLEGSAEPMKKAEALLKKGAG